MWNIFAFLFPSQPVFPPVVSADFLLLTFISSTRLLISICNLSFSSNTLSLSCLFSIQRHCASPLIEFQTYPLRCSCFSLFLSDVCSCLFHFTCASLFPNLFPWASCHFLLPFFFLCGSEHPVSVAFIFLS